MGEKIFNVWYVFVIDVILPHTEPARKYYMAAINIKSTNILGMLALE